MDWEYSLFNIAIVIIFYESSHAYLYFKSEEVKRERENKREGFKQR
jgi:hypothetical protein